MIENTIEQFKAARRVSVPIVAVTTMDQQATVRGLAEMMNGEVPKLVWDMATGLRKADNNQIEGWPSDLIGEATIAPQGFIEVIDAFNRLPDNAKPTLFVYNAHRLIEEDPMVSQALGNSREPSKATGRMVVLLAPALTLPAELEQDVYVIDEPLPDTKALAGIVLQTYKDAVVPGQKYMAEAAEALTGLSAFAADQASALSMTPDGIDLEALWERKRQMIDATPGLSIWRGDESYDKIGGVQNIKDFLRRLTTGKRAPRAIVFIDEIEKAMSGSSEGSQDTSGVSQDYLGVMLEYMQDTKATGMIFVGPPGAAKSVMAKAAGNEAGIPTIKLDLGGLKAAGGGLVGGAERTIRQALKIISAVGSDNVLFIATSNEVTSLPPALRRRFGLGTYYFDLPDVAERLSVWKIYADWTDGTNTRPEDEGWTGAEIEKCVDIADRLGCTLQEAAEYIVPVSRVDPEGIERLRRQASGRYINASKPGVYRMEDPSVQAPKGRKMEV